MDTEEKFELVTRNLAEVIEEKELKEQLAKKKILLSTGEQCPQAAFQLRISFP